jgi:hypothetical protein
VDASINKYCVFIFLLALLVLPVAVSGAGPGERPVVGICPGCNLPGGPDIGGFLWLFAGLALVFRLIIWPLIRWVTSVAETRRIAKDARELPTRLAKAENGDVDAQYKLGRMYEYGEGVAPNAVEARKWYQKAVDQGHPGAQYRITQMNVGSHRY